MPGFIASVSVNHRIMTIVPSTRSVRGSQRSEQADCEMMKYNGLNEWGNTRTVREGLSGDGQVYKTICKPPKLQKQLAPNSTQPCGRAE